MDVSGYDSGGGARYRNRGIVRRVGTIAMMGVILFKAQPSIVDLLIAFCVPLAVVFVTQVWVGAKTGPGLWQWSFLLRIGHGA
jgi:hypothetical protein